MTYLLVTDTHLDDQPENEYRWLVFEHVRQAVEQHGVETVFHLGDLVDRRDRFSAAFVNRLLGELCMIAKKARVVVMRGNHDTTLRRPNYFEFLNSVSPPRSHPIQYVNEPILDARGVLLLPFSAQPRAEWSRFRLSDYRAVFMHATVPGAVVENGQVMENPNFPLLPGRVKFYSGDVHVPQRVRNVTYVGAPHPIRFGDSYPCRMLLLDDGFEVEREIILSGPRKLVAAVSGLDGLDALATAPGDQVKLRFALLAGSLDGWHMDDARIAEWARERGVTVAGVEVSLESRYDAGSVDPDGTPEALLRQFAAQEGLSDDLLAVGLRLLG